MDPSKWLNLPIVLRNGTYGKANQNMVLLQGEPAMCFYPDGSRPTSMKVGDGVSTFSALPEVAPVWSVNGKTGNIGLVIADIPSLQSTLDAKATPAMISAAIASAVLSIAAGQASVTMAALAVGTQTVSIPGLTSAHHAVVSLVSNGGLSLSAIMSAFPVVVGECTSGTLTISVQPQLPITGTLGVNYAIYG